MNARVPERHCDAFQWPMVSSRVQPDRHGGADSQARQQIIVWIWSCITTADAYGFIRNKATFTSSDLLLKICRAATHHDVRRLFVGLRSHDWIRDGRLARTHRDTAR